ncbi:MAG: arsenite methyltransferase [Planctomycetota bacterium]
MNQQDKTTETIRTAVRDRYSQIAENDPHHKTQESSEGSGCCGGGTCGTGSFGVTELAQGIGYTKDELATTPDGANMGLSCGNPTAIASLKSGEVVLDLGSGGGFDCFIAGPKVGPTGRVIGVDMTPAMLTKARSNTAAYQSRTGLNNVEFRLGEIEHLPVADSFVDVVISNCVLNLSPDKPQVWREIARVLKHGGRVAVSDLALYKPLPTAIKESVEALVGCIAGAALIEDIREMMQAAGLMNIKLTPKSDYIATLQAQQDALLQNVGRSLPPGATLGDYITSLDISAARG